MSGSTDTIHYSANLFDTAIDNLISYNAVLNRPVNVDQAHITGLDLVIGGLLWGWNSNASLSLISPKNESGGSNDGNLLARRPEQSFDLGFQRTYGKLNTVLDVHAQGHSYDDLANTRRLAGFTTVNLNLGYAVSHNWLLKLSLNNLLDKAYETAEYYNQDGFNALFTLRYVTR